MRPLYDYLTEKKGNFIETVQAVENICKYVGENLTIEIKLLLAKETVKHNLAVVKYLTKQGMVSKCKFSLNLLIISKTVVKNLNMFCDDYSILMNESCSLLEYCFENNIEIITSLIPICFLPYKYKEVLLKNYCSQSEEVYYNDKSNQKNNVIKDMYSSSEECNKCVYCEICPKFPKTYLEYISH